MVYEVSQVKFRFYTSEELQKIATVEVSEVITFDGTGQPRSGGLYDRKMGPVKRGDLCDTCGLSERFCPGHLGYIKLKTPLIHPLMFAQLQSMLKMCCVYCQKLTVLEKTKRLWKLKFECLALGMTKVVGEYLSVIDAKVSKEDTVEEEEDEETEILDKVTKRKKQTQEENDQIEELETQIKAHISRKLKEFGCKSISEYVKLVENDPSVMDHAEHATATKQFTDACVKQKICTGCGRNGLRFKAAPAGHKGLFLTVSGKASTYEANEKKGAICEHVANMVKGYEKPSNIFVWPQYLRDILEKVWKADEDLLRFIFGADFRMFFLEMIPVPANRYRPTNMVNGVESESAFNGYFGKIISRNKDINFVEDKKEEISAKISEMQVAINNIIDSGTMQDSEAFAGIKQVLERKKGLFRMNMMGKRVNFAARSVILPDPNIETDEVGVPQVFAKKLSYPERVTSFNAQQMMKLVIQGPNNYPGANYIGYVKPDGTLIKQALDTQTNAQRQDLAKKLLVGDKIVYRHVRDGDIFLVNRQPTLHRPSIMAHKARVFGNQRTIRLHYANCASYNADFDGDEMNLHLPQNEVARSEAYNIMVTSNQYISPTSGYPIRGLIQDNLSSAVLLTMKDCFLTREEYHALLYGALYNHTDDREIKTLPPAIFKPKQLWTGKQVVSTILIHLADGRRGINLDGTTRIKGTVFGADSEEGEVVVRENQLLCGILDKKHFGAEKDSIVHCTFECYGPDTAGKLLTVLCRMCMIYLQIYGFTCGLDDLLLSKKIDEKRTQLLQQANDNAISSAIKFCKVVEKHNAIEKVKQILSVSLKEERFSRQLDFAVKSSINEKTSEIIKSAIPDGQAKPFRKNFFAQMTSSGAKGSAVNFSQVVCCLGQQEFEGRRVQPMASGKTLPSFKEFDISAMSGGFVASRFITGIKPQEYFFHTMGGRDGLIDTAVKTARSGYLQRCLVKHLENISVQYDRTVRDNFGSVVQFDYGGDSIDTSKHAMMAQFKFLIMSKDAITERYQLDKVLNNFPIESHSHSKVERHIRKKIKEPLISVYPPDRYFGSISEKYREQINEYVTQNPDGLIGTKISEVEFRQLCHLKYLTSLVEAGEAVGVLAAQGIGEPSTQMTLNTFHSAGMDVAHVTVGIPRLRQLFMVGTVSEPIITLPMKKGIEKEAVDVIHDDLESISLHQMTTEVKITQSSKVGGSRVYKLSIQLDSEKYKSQGLRSRELKSGFTSFLKEMNRQIKRYLGGKVRDAKGEELLQDGDTDGTKRKKGSKAIDSDASGHDVSKKKQQSTYSDDDEEEKEEVEKLDEDDEEEKKTVDEDEKDDDITETNEKNVVGGAVGGFGTYKAQVSKEKLTIEVDYSFIKKRSLFFSHFVELCSKRVFLRSTKDIHKVLLNEKEGNYTFTIEGSNFDHVYTLDEKICDFNNILTNDVNIVVQRYGIEAGRALIIKDSQSVFSMYGIPVNERHIALIADYMTYLGFYKSCNRHALVYRPGPWHKMTFEQSTKFLMDAAVRGEVDPVTGPSSRIIFGRLPDQGTGCFDVRLDIGEVLK